MDPSHFISKTPSTRCNYSDSSFWTNHNRSLSLHRTQFDRRLHSRTIFFTFSCYSLLNLVSLQQKTENLSTPSPVTTSHDTSLYEPDPPKEVPAPKPAEKYDTRSLEKLYTPSPIEKTGKRWVNCDIFFSLHFRYFIHHCWVGHWPIDPEIMVRFFHCTPWRTGRTRSNFVLTTNYQVQLINTLILYTYRSKHKSPERTKKSHKSERRDSHSERSRDRWEWALVPHFTPIHQFPLFLLPSWAAFLFRIMAWSAVDLTTYLHWSVQSIKLLPRSQDKSRDRSRDKSRDRSRDRSRDKSSRRRSSPDARRSSKSGGRSGKRSRSTSPGHYSRKKDRNSKPDCVSVLSTTIWIGNMRKTVTKADISSLMKKYTESCSIDVS